MRKAKDLHLFLMLATAEAYLSKARNEGLTSEPLHIKMISGINGWLTFRRLDKEEQELLVELGKDEYMEKMKEVEVSYVIYALVLLQLAAETYTFNIGVGRKKLLKGRSVFIISMIQQKRKDPEKHAELKAIIDDSVVIAKKFFGFTEAKIKGMV